FVDVHEFCERAGFRLPSEEEWEYACRAGTETPWSFGAYSPEAFERYAWPPSASPLPAHPVGKKRPNAFGLYDMHSGVREWCDPGSAWGDYSGPGQLLGVSRGGPSFVDAQQCRSAVRVLHVPYFGPEPRPRGTTQSSTSSEVGFRPAISLP
ncbi:MAG: formylglycine-generating enzyme family protein, partial [Planctomycetes bacterium]|nr:formylglycine-generating enzyme family protein [Planctomycetota bacterium]